MKHAYIIYFKYYANIRFIMPYLFTSYKEAVLYGEYAYRTKPNLLYYEIERIDKLSTRFYALK